MSRFDMPLPDLVAYRPRVHEPADFDEFWARTLGEARSARRSAPVLGPRVGAIDAVDAYDVRFDGFGGEPIAAWLLVPRDRAALRGAVVQYVGYGGGRGSVHEHLAWSCAGYAHLVMDSRGQGSGWSPGVTPDAWGSGPAIPGMLTRGIDDPRTFYYRRLIADAVRAVDAVRELDLVAPENVSVHGVSQGGGLALAVAGLVPDVAALVADVPFLCHFERAVGLTDALPYREIADYLRIHRDRVELAFSTLSFFDGVNFARRAQAPALFSTALEDIVCPPSTVFAAKNAYGGDAEIDVLPFNGHEGGGAERWPRLWSWLTELRRCEPSPRGAAPRQ